MQRLFNLDKWLRLPEGQALEFSNTMPRTVRIDVNAPRESALYVQDDDGELWFLALVKGRDTIEFSADGAFKLLAEGSVEKGGEVMVYTADGADVSMTVDAPESFTRIVERRKRNPELEAIVATMNRNLERRLDQQARDLEQRIRGSLGNGAPVPAAASVPAGPPPAPGQTRGAGSSNPQVAAPAGGSEGGGGDAGAGQGAS